MVGLEVVAWDPWQVGLVGGTEAIRRLMTTTTGI